MNLPENLSFCPPPTDAASVPDAGPEQTSSAFVPIPPRIIGAGPPVCVLSNRRIPGGIALGDIVYMSLEAVLSTRFVTDAHFSACACEEEVPQRLTMAKLEAHAFRMNLMVFDVDDDEAHAAGSNAMSSSSWFDAERIKIERLRERHPSPFIARTPRGYRIFFGLEPATTVASVDDARAWSLYYVRSVTHLAREFGIVADPACSDCTRIFRAPHATRAGSTGPESLETIGNVTDVGTWTFRPSEFELDADIAIAADIAATNTTWKGRALGVLLRHKRTFYELPPKPVRMARRGSVLAPTAVPDVSAVGEVTDDPQVLRRAHLYIAKLPPAISGQAGHAATFRAALAAVRGFALSTEAALRLMSEYNLRAEPPWSLQEIEHKVADAGRSTQVPHGYLLNRRVRDLLDDVQSPVQPAKREIIVRVEQHQVVDEALEALGKHPAVFQRGGNIVQVVTDAMLNGGSAGPRIAEIADPRLRECLTEVASWTARNAKGELIAVHPPVWVGQTTRARAMWGKHLRVLQAVVTSPSLRPDGTILDVPGYDEQSGLLFLPDRPFLPVPSAPTRDDAVAAAAELLEVFADFPVVSPAHHAAILAGILGPLARHAHSGPTPLIVFDASTAGSGKGLTADVISVIVHGRTMTRMPQANSEEEERKRVLAIVISGVLCVLIDNVNRPLGSGALDAVLTATEWSDRVLGTSKTAGGPLVTQWFATGNNVVLVGDTARRVLVVRLEPDCERPELRTGFRHPNLLSYVRRERPRLLRAALTMLRAYFVAGAPNLGLSSWGSFEEWSGIVRNAAVFAGLSDPGDTRASTTQRADVESGAVADLLSGLQQLCAQQGKTSVSAAEVIDILGANLDRYSVVRNALSELSKIPAGRHASARDLGYVLRRQNGRIVGGLRLTQDRKSHGSVRWSVDAVSAPATIVATVSSGAIVPGGASALPTSGGDGGDGGDVSRTRIDVDTNEVAPGEEGGETSSIDPMPSITSRWRVPRRPSDAMRPLATCVNAAPFSVAPATGTDGKEE